VLLSVAFLAQCGHGLANHSGTCDELGAHVPAGILAWRSGRFSGGLANPPLGQLLVAAGPVLTGSADRPLADGPRDLLPARIPVVLLGLATVLAIGALGRRLAGDTAGLAAIGAAALSPNLVAHSGLATLDLPVTAFATLAVLAAWTWARTGNRVALLGWSFAIASATMTKFSALHLFLAVPVGAALVGPDRWRRPLGLLAAGAAGTFVLSWILYGAGGGARFSLPSGLIDGLGAKWAHGQAGHLAYLLGQRSADGFPHYFLVALAVKVPLALQAAALAGGVALVRRRVPGDASGFFAFALFPALWIFAALSLVHHVDIGVRHALPCFPALLALAGAGWAVLWRSGRVRRAIAVTLAVGAVLSAATTTPRHLSYFHRLAGGPARADRILIDSNLDWGQEEGQFRSWASGRDVAVNPSRPVAGLVAANVNALRGALSRDDFRLRWLRRLEPEIRIGDTWRVYRADDERINLATASAGPVGALDRAWWLIGTGRASEAADVLARNDLSAHPDHAAAWWRLSAEVALAAGDPASAARAAVRSGDPYLAAVSVWQVESQGDPARRPPSDSDALRVITAFARRGDAARASDLSRTWFGRDVTARSEPDDLAEAIRQRTLGREETALQIAGRALAREPANEDLLSLYGELVVRRKLGLTEFPLPVVDWSGIQRNPGR